MLQRNTKNLMNPKIKKQVDIRCRCIYIYIPSSYLTVSHGKIHPFLSSVWPIELSIGAIDTNHG